MSRVLIALLVGFLVAGVAAWWFQRGEDSASKVETPEQSVPVREVSEAEANRVSGHEETEPPKSDESLEPGEPDPKSSDLPDVDDPPVPDPDLDGPPANTGDRRFEYSRPPDES